MTKYNVIPTEIKLLQKTRIVEITFDNGRQFNLPCEYLRVYSPSAETRGHGSAEINFPKDKQSVNIISIEPIGNYAVKFYFDDNHNTGIYSWDYLYELGLNQESNWQRYQHYTHHT